MLKYCTAFILLAASFASCSAPKPFSLITSVKEKDKPGGSAFFQQAAAYDWKQRDSLVQVWFESGYVPDFLQRFSPVKVYGYDSASKKRIQLIYYVSPDYFAVGNDEDWARVPITPILSQQMLKKLQCFLPTTKMVDDIYAAAKVKLSPVPMYAFRDSTVTMWQHHLMLEGQRKGRKGLIAGIKKDLVASEKLLNTTKPNRVAIYGWHKPDGKPIQPLYTGHVNWYVDYSHGTRMVSRKMKLNGKWKDAEELLKNPYLRQLLTNESSLVMYPY